ncbi:MAG: type IV pilus twitching motility protein PilT [Planctomycetota bacterium]
MSTIQIDKLLKTVITNNASDLHLVVGRPPILRLHGRLRPLDLPILGAEDTTVLMKSITSDRSQQVLQEKGGVDFGFSFGEDRFRVNVYRERGNLAIALRLIPSHLLSFEEIGLPASLKELLFKPKGLILVTGPTGCGKTTTLATLTNHINTERDAHILTIEQPIEYYHKHNKSIINHREVGVDVGTFHEAVIQGLREDPDVILVGEMRDLDTIQAALRAAETGHLVMSTLHTTGAARTITRIIDAFPNEQQEQVRQQIAVSLLAVISQDLLPRADGKGRVAAFEIMILTPAVENLIRENKVFRIDSAIQTGKKLGMTLMDDSLYELFISGKIAYDEMISSAQDPSTLESKIKLRALDTKGGGR